MTAETVMTPDERIALLEREVSAAQERIEELHALGQAAANRADDAERRLDGWYTAEAQIRGALLELVGDDVYLKAIDKALGRRAIEHNPRLADDVSVTTNDKGE